MNFIKYNYTDEDYNTCFWYNLTCVTMPDSKGIEIDFYSRIVEDELFIFKFNNINKNNQQDFFMKCPGFNWDDSLYVAQKFYININY